MEVKRRGEILADQRRADDAVAVADQAAVRLIGEDQLADAEHEERIKQTGDEGQQDQQAECGPECRGNFRAHDETSSEAGGQAGVELDVGRRQVQAEIAADIELQVR